MIKCVVLDDDPVYCSMLASFVKDHETLQLEGKFTDPVKAKHFLEKSNIDLLFADMEMPGANGIDFVRSLRYHPYVIFITSHRDFAVESYELDAVDYIIKPIKQQRFNIAVEKALKHLEGNSEDQDTVNVLEDHFFIRADSQFVRIKYEDVIYIEALKDFVKIHTPAKAHIALINLKNMEDALPSYLFIRTHRSYLVNRKHISAINTHDIETMLGEVPLGNSYKDAVLETVLGKKLIKR